MPLLFELLDRDIAGRIGRLRVGERSMRTPALLPVVNPHLPLVTPGEMRRMGVEALITNAYIFYRSGEFRGLVERDGLHRTLGFDGIVMTDSGAFQQSVYGEVEVTNREIVEFQLRIGSDILVPLDIPTPPDTPRERAERELEETMRRLAEARALAGDRVCAGPVQGGMFEDLRERAAEAVQGMGFGFCPVGAVVPLMEQYRYPELVRVVMAAKRGLSHASCVHLFGAGHPSMFALAVAMGCDIFDSAAYALFAKEGRYLTVQGTRFLREMEEFSCLCPVCSSHTPGELVESPGRERLLALHNLHVTIAEISRIREAIREGTLWELLDERCRSHPRLLQGYRNLLAHAEELERSDRAVKRRFFYRGDESCRRTEVVRYRSLIGRIALPEEAHVFVGCPPGPCSGSTLLFKPPFGPYPPALAETFPIGQSELPEWDDAMVRAGCEGIRALAGSHPGTLFRIHCTSAWHGLLSTLLPGMEVIREPD